MGPAVPRRTMWEGGRVRRENLIPFLVLLLFLASAAATSDPVFFSTRMVDTSGRTALEPVLAFAQDGKVYYAGMSTPDGHLWSAADRTSNFVYESSQPPSSGGTDATVFVPPSNAVYFVELDGVMDTSWKVSGSWTRYTFEQLSDRPWFGEKDSEVYLASAGGQASLEVRKKTDDAATWTDVWTEALGNPVASGISFADYRLVRGTHYFLFTAHDTGNWFVRFGTGAWSTTDPLPLVDHPQNIGKFGLPRLDVDDDNNIYVGWGEKRGNDFGVWLSRTTGTSWSTPFMVSSGLGTAGFLALAAKGPGRVGVGFYESSQRTYPDLASDEALWDFNYTLVVGANSQPRVEARAVIMPTAEAGSLVRSDIGDFSSAQVIPGTSRGWVALAFACTTVQPLCKPEGSSQGAFPAFSDQREGPGLVS